MSTFRYKSFLDLIETNRAICIFWICLFVWFRAGSKGKEREEEEKRKRKKKKKKEKREKRKEKRKEGKEKGKRKKRKKEKEKGKRKKGRKEDITTQIHCQLHLLESEVFESLIFSRVFYFLRF